MRILAGAPAPGSPNADPRPRSTRFFTIVGQPKTIALKFATGKPVTSRITGEQQMMYTLTSGEKAYFSLDVAAAIDSLTLAPGQPFTVCHLGGGNWEIDRVHEAPAAPIQRAPAPQPARYWGNQTAPTANSPETDTPAPRVSGFNEHTTALKTNGAGETSAAILAGYYPHAIEIALAGAAAAQAKGLMLAPTFEDIRCIATTLFINQTGGRQ